tara:strand:- start:134 stop:937 length:804 start_codon:yes stop_codon:yes gene_type:complete
MRSQSVKQQLRSGARLNGCWIEAFSPIATEIMAMSGYDTAMIDLEHGPGSPTEAVVMMQALSAHQCKPMIRATSGDPAVIKRILDIGPLGMMVPNVRSVQEARDVVAACRYGPDGFRGAAPALLRATGYGENVTDYEHWMTEEFLLIIQIESKEAVDEIDAIAAVEGIDMLFIGPSDLSASLGALGQFGSTEFIEAFEKIEQAVLTSGKYLGTIPFSDWDSQRLYSNGHHLVLAGTDTLLLREAAGRDVQQLRQACRNGSWSVSPTV